MQVISHKNSTLTVCQRFFIEKSIELLYLGSIDSYRVRLNNPLSALVELKYCLDEFSSGRIKHFQTIKAKEKDKKAIVDEVLYLLESDPNYLVFGIISKSYLQHLLRSIDEFNFKKVIFSIDFLIKANADYINSILAGLETLIAANNPAMSELEKIDTSAGILFSELIHKGYSKGFLYKLVYGVFVNSLTQAQLFENHYQSFRARVLQEPEQYDVVFRIDTTAKVYESISAINSATVTLSDHINHVQLTGTRLNELRTFNTPLNDRKFITCAIVAADYLSALKQARSILSEYLDVINLGLSDEFLHIHNRVLVIDVGAPQNAAFQNNINILDGKYKVTKDYYLEFTRKLPVILNNAGLQSDAKEKIKSAIRYLRLGNQSTEVEHKFINYWIGLEYLFSNYESHSTINRVKDHLINAHALAYVKRNVYWFKNAFDDLDAQYKALVNAYTVADFSCLASELFYQQVAAQLINIFPLIAYRAGKLHKWLFPAGKAANAKNYLKKHSLNLEVHLTRIYRFRNEIIHDAVTNTNNEHIASNLRYYLTFILNEMIDFFSKNSGNEVSIEDYFIMNEIELENIEQKGYLLTHLLEVDCSIDFII